MPDRLNTNIQSYDALRAAIANAMPLSKRLDGLFLGGSYGRGTQDQWSDLDYIAVAEPEHATYVADVWLKLLRKLAPPVLMYRRGNQQISINIVTKDWLRCDLVVACAQRFAERFQNDLKAVYDPKSLLNTLRIAPKPPTTDETHLTALVQDFVRILGLLPTGIKRGKLYTVQFGLGILRDHVAQFLTEAAGLTGRSGALNLSRDLSSKDMSLLNDLPIGSKSSQPLIEDYIKIATVFLPLAKRHCDTHGAEWPADLINAAANSLETLIGDANAQQFRQLQH